MIKTYTTTIKEFTQKYLPAFGDRTWDEAVADMLEEPTEAEIVDQLILEYQRTHKFRIPILVGYDDEKDLHTVENGMHRTVAAILLGEDTIIEYKIFPQENTPEYDEWYANLEKEKWYDIIISSPDNLTVEEKTESFEYITDRFRSLKINDNYWLSVDLSSTINGGPTTMLFSYAGNIEEIQKDIINTLQQKTKENEKLSKYIKNITIQESEDLDEEEN